MEFETLYQELAHGATIIPTLLSGITEADSRLRPNADSWSILEVICHLYDEERDDFRERLDLILNRPHDELKPIHPSAWVTERRYNERNFAESLDAFIAERHQSLEWLKGLSSANWESEYVREGRRLKAGEMFASWVAHDNLHCRQLVELRRSRIERITPPYDIGYAGDW